CLISCPQASEVRTSIEGPRDSPRRRSAARSWSEVTSAPAGDRRQATGYPCARPQLAVRTRWLAPQRAPTGSGRLPKRRIRRAERGWGACAGEVCVGPNQHGVGSGDRAKHRKPPPTNTVSVDQPDPIRPWRDVEAAGLTQIE